MAWHFGRNNLTLAVIYIILTTALKQISQVACNEARPITACGPGQHAQGFDADYENLLPDARCIPCEEETFNDEAGVFISCKNCAPLCDTSREEETVSCTRTTDRVCVCRKGMKNQSLQPGRLICVKVKDEYLNGDPRTQAPHQAGTLTPQAVPAHVSAKGKDHTPSLSDTQGSAVVDEEFEQDSKLENAVQAVNFLTTLVIVLIVFLVILSGLMIGCWVRMERRNPGKEQVSVSPDARPLRSRVNSGDQSENTIDTIPPATSYRLTAESISDHSLPSSMTSDARAARIDSGRVNDLESGSAVRMLSCPKSSLSNVAADILDI